MKVKAWLLLTILVLSFGTTLLLPPTRASAAGLSSDLSGQVEDKVLDHQLYFFLMACFYNRDMDYVPASQVASWDWLQGGASMRGGTGTRGAMYQAASPSCEEERYIEEAFKQFGFTDAEDAFCSLDFTYSNNFGGLGYTDDDHPDTKDACLAGVEGGGGFDGSGDLRDQQNAVDKLLQKSGKYATAKGDLTDAQKYIRAYRSLITGCNVRLIQEFDPTKDTHYLTDEDNYYQVPIVQQGEDSHFFVLGQGGDNGNHDDVVRFVATRDGGYQVKRCIDLVTEAQRTAMAYLEYLNTEGKDDSIDDGGGDDDGVLESDYADIDPCEATGFNLSWIVCPVINMISAGIMAMEGIIYHLLEVDVTEVFDRNTSSSAEAYYAAWNSFRIFAIMFIVIAGLVMVISQALGFEIFDAYTVKKVLPRMFIAAIAIALSWYLLEFLVRFTNDLGLAIRSIIYYPFKDIEGAGGQTLGSSFVEMLIGGATLFVLGIGGALSLIATAGLAALIAFVVLILRQLVIIMLIIMAPLAIACFVLPNTKKVYDVWWDSLSKGLMMYPIIAGFIAVGHVFSQVTSAYGGGAGSSINKVVAIAAYFLPYFALPFTFRLAGGALATIGGLTNDRSRGAFDRLKKFRGARAADRMHRARNNNLWDNNSKIGRRANVAAGWVTDPVGNTAFAGRNIPGLRKRGQGIAYAIDQQRSEQSQKLFEEVNKMGDNDRAYRAMAGRFEGMSEETQRRLRDTNLFDRKTGTYKAPTSLDDLHTVAGVLRQSSSATEQTAASAIEGTAGRLANLYRDQDMGKASIQAAGIMGLSAHGFASGKDIADTANDLMKDGSIGFANAIAQQSQVLVGRSRPDAKAGYGTVFKDGKFVSGVQNVDDNGNIITYNRADGSKNTDALGLRGFDVLKSVGPGDIAGAKGGLLKGVDKSGIGDHLDFILRSGNSQAAKDAQTQVSKWSEDEKNRQLKTRAGREKMRLANAAELYVPMRDQLLQSSSYYSHASSDIKSSASKILEDTGHGDLLKDYAADGRRAAPDPTKLGAEPAQPPDDK